MIKRWTISRLSQAGSATINEIASWVQPNAQVDRDWPDDDRLIWGYSTDRATSSSGSFPAVAIFAGDKEVHVRRIQTSVKKANGQGIIGAEVHIFTPDSTYNPVAITPGEFFPFLQTGRRPNNLKLPRARVIAGKQNSLPSFLIGGVLVAPAIGPRFIQENDVIFQSILTPFPKATEILNLADPPIIIAPFGVLAVQWFNPLNEQVLLFVNFMLSERETA